MTFDDGIVNIYNVINAAQAGDMPRKALRNPHGFFYHDETVGVTRYYEAVKAGQTIERVIAIPWPATITTNEIAVLEDNSQYQIRMVQLATDENGLKIYRLSLERNGEDYEII